MMHKENHRTVFLFTSVNQDLLTLTEQCTCITIVEMYHRVLFSLRVWLHHKIMEYLWKKHAFLSMIVTLEANLPKLCTA